MREARYTEQPSSDVILRALNVAGYTKLAAEVLGSKPLPNIPETLANSHKYQRKFVSSSDTYRAAPLSQPLAVQLTDPRCRDAVQENRSFATPNNILLLDLSISRAPTSFLYPVLAKRKYDVPFLVTLRCTSTIPVSYKMTVTAHAIDEEQVEKLDLWTPTNDRGLLSSEVTHTVQLKPVPRPAAAAVPPDVDGSSNDSSPRQVGMCDTAVVPQTESLSGGGGNGATTTGNKNNGAALVCNYAAAQTFSFDGLAFDKPSSLRPRWLVFELTVPNTSIRIFTQFLFPTIAMSRISEQQDKCTKALFVRPLVDLSGPHGLEYISYEVQRGLNLRRGLTEACLETIAKNATLIGYTQKSSLQQQQQKAGTAGTTAANTTTAVCSNNHLNSAVMQESLYTMTYLSRTRKLLDVIRAYYERTDATIISDFSVDREESERILRDFEVGTFLLRFGTESGSLVASVLMSKTDKRVSIYHVKITVEALKKASLEVILSGVPNASMLLDVNKKLAYSKSVVLQRGYVNPLEVEKIVQQHRAPKRMLAAAASTAELSASHSDLLGTRCAPITMQFPPAAAAAIAQFNNNNNSPPTATADIHRQQLYADNLNDLTAAMQYSNGLYPPPPPPTLHPTALHPNVALLMQQQQQQNSLGAYPMASQIAAQLAIAAARGVPPPTLPPQQYSLQQPQQQQFQAIDSMTGLPAPPMAPMAAYFHLPALQGQQQQQPTVSVGTSGAASHPTIIWPPPQLPKSQSMIPPGVYPPCIQAPLPPVTPAVLDIDVMHQHNVAMQQQQTQSNTNFVPTALGDYPALNSPVRSSGETVRTVDDVLSLPGGGGGGGDVNLLPSLGGCGGAEDLTLQHDIGNLMVGDMDFFANMPPQLIAGLAQGELGLDHGGGGGGDII